MAEQVLDRAQHLPRPHPSIGVSIPRVQIRGDGPRLVTGFRAGMGSARFTRSAANGAESVAKKNKVSALDVDRVDSQTSVLGSRADLRLTMSVTSIPDRGPHRIMIGSTSHHERGPHRIMSGVHVAS